jgi:hypothetical protein
MQNHLPGGPSLRRFAPRRAEETSAPLLMANTGNTRAGMSKVSGQRLRSHLKVVDRAEADDRLASGEAAIRKSSGPDASRRSSFAGRLRAAMKAIGDFAAHGAVAFESIVLAAMSFAIAEMLAGCAAYCQAMHPTFVEPAEPADGDDVADGG